jgi:hypothetical protein
MSGRTAIAIILGLLMQWAQVASYAAVTECGQGAAAIHCDGCEAMASCPCATEGDPGPEPAPVPVLPNSLKLPVARLVETQVEPKAALVLPIPRWVVSRAVAGPMTGYAGVSRSVAFCSFII